MRTKRAIENQLQHFRNGCPKAGTEENDTWVKALEWVLGPGDDPTVDGLTPYGTLIRGAIAARDALYNYMHENAAPSVGKIADDLDRAMIEAWNTPDRELAKLFAEIEGMHKALAEFKSLGRKGPD